MGAMQQFGNIMTALLIFMTGVVFAYFSYPFMNSLLSAISATEGIWEGWSYINAIAWLGYITITLLWIVYFPIQQIYGQQDNNVSGGM